MAYDINHEIVQVIHDTVNIESHVLKTLNHIAVFLFCDTETRLKAKAKIDEALHVYRKKYNVYVMTEQEYLKSR